jgi:epoxide hydrolase-like predicted phosphatase
VTEPRSDPAGGGPRALIVDYGGVLTSPPDGAMRAWCQTDGVDHEHFAALMAQWFRSSDGSEAPTNPAHQLERGELSGPDFEQLLARELRTADGRPVTPAGILTRMFAGFRPAPTMVDVVRRVRAAGHPTALLSNSWGLDYDRAAWGDLFDVTVISGEVGMRKPEPEIYLLTAERLGIPPSACVFVDDLGPNVTGAVKVGMVGVRHVSDEQTVAELEVLLGLSLAAA